MRDGRPVETIFFDAAGTLFRVRGSVGDIYQRHAVQFGFCPTVGQDAARQISQAFLVLFGEKEPMVFPGHPADAIPALERLWWLDLVERTFDRVGPFARVEEFFDHIYEVFRTSEVWEVEPGCEQLLSRLKDSGKKLGIVSNFDSRIGDVLEALRIRRFFDTVVISSGGPAAKPDPAIFLHALESVSTVAEASLHVGDDVEDDFEGARGAGLQALLYDPRGRFTQQIPEFRIRSLAEVCSFVR